jgi:hypothetical protein
MECTARTTAARRRVGRRNRQKPACRAESVITIDPLDIRHVFVGGVGYGRLAQDNDLGGLYVTTDAGRTWSKLTVISSQNYWCH